MMRRLVAGIASAGIGLGTYLLWPSRVAAFAAALGSYALADRLGLLPDPYEPTVRDMLQGNEEDRQ